MTKNPPTKIMFSTIQNSIWKLETQALNTGISIFLPHLNNTITMSNMMRKFKLVITDELIKVSVGLTNSHDFYSCPIL